MEKPKPVELVGSHWIHRDESDTEALFYRREEIDAYLESGPTPSLEKELVKVAVNSLINHLKQGILWSSNYTGTFKVPKEILDRIYSQIDYDRVVEIMGNQINEMVATKITAAMTTEVTTDVKSVLSHGPTRDHLRSIIAAEILNLKKEKK